MSKRPVDPNALARDELIAFLRYAPSAREAVINMGDPTSTAARTPWQDAAADELRRKLAVMMSSFSLNLLNHLQLGAIDSVAVAEAAQAAEHDLLPVAGESQAPITTTTVLSPGTTWTDAPVEVRKSLASVALEFVGVPTLGVRNWDSLDFYSIDVASLREALLAAYVAGQQPAGSAVG